MGLYSHRSKQTGEFLEQKWDYISLPDFKTKGCGEGFAYFWLWLMLIVSVAVYALDTFVAVNLLVFDQWSSNIEPGIPLHISKWIFSVCILMSFVNLAYEAFRAFRIMRRGNVAECYLDSLAVRWESIRMGSGQGWRRFLVFAALTKSKKGAEYVALFTYFSLKAWIRVLICSGPRQVINMFTFKSVYESKLATSEANVESSITGFFEKIKSLAEEDYQQALVLGSMAFTFVVWVFSLIFLISAILCYVTFLCHWIPRSDGGLSGYCERKVNQTLKKIVTQRVNKALAKGQAKQYEAELKAAKKNGEIGPLERMATLPTLPNVGPGLAPAPAPSHKSKLAGEDALPEMPVLGRSETTTTLPPYTSRPASPGGIEMDTMSQRRPIPTRTGTMASATTTRSYSSKASLLGAAADMGHGRASPAPALPDINFNVPPPGPGTPVSQRTFGSRAGMAHAPNDSDSSFRMQMANSPAPMGHPTNRSMDSFGQPMVGRQYDAYNPDSRASPAPSNLNQRSTPGSRQYNAYHPDGRASPAPSGMPYRNEESMMAPHNPMRSATGPVPPRGPYQPPQRNLTAPVPPRGADGDYFSRGMRPTPPQGYDRSGTPQSERGGPYGYDIETQRNQGYGF